jgi:orotidine-5'-phosphate decarboxylase
MEDKLGLARDKIIVALDGCGPRDALRIVNNLNCHVWGFKVGLEMMTSIMAGILAGNNEESEVCRKEARALFMAMGDNVFWDQKLNDIPNTVGSAARALAPISPYFIDVHASAGIKAIAQVVENKGRSKVLGISVLTSIDEASCHSIFGDSVQQKVLRFARDLVEFGADGLVCSPNEVGMIKSYKTLESLILVTPGVRPSWFEAGDQKRVATPKDAVLAGANYIVVGRPITGQPDDKSQRNAVLKIAEEIAEAI